MRFRCTAFPVLVGLILWFFAALPVQAGDTWSPSPDAEEERSVPGDKSFTAYKGESHTFFFAITDKDTKTNDITCVDEEVNDNSWRQSWSITGKASFTDPGVDPNDRSREVDQTSAEITIYILDTFSASDSITVSVNSTDLSDEGPPGSSIDTTSTPSTSWTITWKDACPTSLTCTDATGPQGVPHPDCTATYEAPASYYYRGDPDIGGVGRPDYEGASVHETFGSITSNIDKDVHVTADGRTAHPMWGNDEWRDFYFGSGNNATFVLDNTDYMGDTHSGFALTAQYLILPPPSPLWYDLPQTYSCNSDSGNLSQNHTIRRHVSDIGGSSYLAIQKSH